MLIFIVLFIYLAILGYLFIGLNKRGGGGNIEPFLSIIIVAKNEQANIADCIVALDHQNYPQIKYEIILVDDNSTDSTVQIAKELSLQTRIQILKGNKQTGWKSSKKACLELARQKAKGEFLLFTDADCRPGPDWVKTMASAFDQSTGLVAGFSPQTSESSILWNGFLEIDSIAAGVVSAGGIGWGHGITCTGRNMAVRSAALLEVGGYSATKDSLSGDDDFLLQEIARQPGWTVNYAKDQRSVVPAIGPPNFRLFIQQKQRHISAGRLFDYKSQIGFALFHGSNCILWLYFIMEPMNAVLLILLKLAADVLLIGQFVLKVGAKFKLVPFFIWELFFPIYHVISAPVAFLGKVSWR